MLCYTFVYLLICLLLFVFKRSYIMGELVRFAADYGQVQRTFLKELDVPYGILDMEGHLIWANNELKDIVEFEKTARHSILEIFPDFSLEQLPTLEEDVTLHITHGRRNFRVQLRTLSLEEYEEDALWSVYRRRSKWQYADGNVSVRRDRDYCVKEGKCRRENDCRTALY